MNFCHGVRVNETAMKAVATMLLSNVTPRSSPNKVDKRNRMQLQEEIDEDSTGNTSSGVEMYAPSVMEDCRRTTFCKIIVLPKGIMAISMAIFGRPFRQHLQY